MSMILLNSLKIKGTILGMSRSGFDEKTVAIKEDRRFSSLQVSEQMQKICVHITKFGDSPQYPVIIHNLRVDLCTLTIDKILY